MLIDPRTNIPFYVGCTVNPERRLKWHYREANAICEFMRHRATATQAYIRTLKEVPVMEILDEVHSDRNGAEVIEGYWISQLLTWGFKLTNLRHSNKSYGKYSEMKLKPTKEYEKLNKSKAA